jgi:hypothetical protein
LLPGEAPYRLPGPKIQKEFGTIESGYRTESGQFIPPISLEPNIAGNLIYNGQRVVVTSSDVTKFGIASTPAITKAGLFDFTKQGGVLLDTEKLLESKIRTGEYTGPRLYSGEPSRLGSVELGPKRVDRGVYADIDRRVYEFGEVADTIQAGLENVELGVTLEGKPVGIKPVKGFLEFSEGLTGYISQVKQTSPFTQGFSIVRAQLNAAQAITELGPALIKTPQLVIKGTGALGGYTAYARESFLSGDATEFTKRARGSGVELLAQTTEPINIAGTDIFAPSGEYLFKTAVQVGAPLVAGKLLQKAFTRPPPEVVRTNALVLLEREGAIKGFDIIKVGGEKATAFRTGKGFNVGADIGLGESGLKLLEVADYNKPPAVPNYVRAAYEGTTPTKVTAGAELTQYIKPLPEIPKTNLPEVKTSINFGKGAGYEIPGSAAGAPLEQTTVTGKARGIVELKIYQSPAEAFIETIKGKGFSPEIKGLPSTTSTYVPKAPTGTYEVAFKSVQFGEARPILTEKVGLLQSVEGVTEVKGNVNIFAGGKPKGFDLKLKQYAQTETIRTADIEVSGPFRNRYGPEPKTFLELGENTDLGLSKIDFGKIVDMGGASEFVAGYATSYKSPKLDIYMPKPGKFMEFRIRYSPESTVRAFDLYESINKKIGVGHETFLSEESVKLTKAFNDEVGVIQVTEVKNPYLQEAIKKNLLRDYSIGVRHEKLAPDAQVLKGVEKLPGRVKQVYDINGNIDFVREVSLVDRGADALARLTQVRKGATPKQIQTLVREKLKYDPTKDFLSPAQEQELSGLLEKAKTYDTLAKAKIGEYEAFKDIEYIIKPELGLEPIKPSGGLGLPNIVEEPKTKFVNLPKDIEFTKTLSEGTLGKEPVISFAETFDAFKVDIKNVGETTFSTGSTYLKTPKGYGPGVESRTATINRLGKDIISFEELGRLMERGPLKEAQGGVKSTGTDIDITRGLKNLRYGKGAGGLDLTNIVAPKLLAEAPKPLMLTEGIPFGAFSFGGGLYAVPTTPKPSVVISDKGTMQVQIPKTQTGGQEVKTGKGMVQLLKEETKTITVKEETKGVEATKVKAETKGPIPQFQAPITLKPFSIAAPKIAQPKPIALTISKATTAQPKPIAAVAQPPKETIRLKEFIKPKQDIGQGERFRDTFANPQRQPEAEKQAQPQRIRFRQLEVEIQKTRQTERQITPAPTPLPLRILPPPPPLLLGKPGPFRYKPSGPKKEETTPLAFRGKSGSRGLLPDLISVAASQTTFGRATSQKLNKKVYKYEANPWGFVPTQEQVKAKKTRIGIFGL